MQVSLQLALDVILGITPVPGLSAGFNLLKLIVSSVRQARESKRQLEALAYTVAQLLETLNAEFRASRLIQSASDRPLQDLHSLLDHIRCFIQEEHERPFFKALFTQNSRISEITGFYRQIGTVASAFQISALFSIQRMLSNNEWAHSQDIENINARLRTMEFHQMHLWRTAATNTSVAQPIPRQRVYFHPRKTADQYHGFTNFSPHRVKYNGKEYPTSEHLYQAFKYMDNRPDIAEKIRTVANSPIEAFKLSTAHAANQHPDWDRMCISKMEIVLYHKFSQNEELRQELLSTGNAEVINYTQGDFWGVGADLQGRNELGKALERVRSSLRETCASQ